MNKVMLLGRIANEIESRTTQNGTSTCTFRIAVNRRYKNANGVYEADFITCVAWRNTADFIAKYFAKGDLICISDGSIQCRDYTAQDGTKRYVTEVIVNEAEFAGKKNAEEKQRTQAHAQAAFEEVEDDDLPF